MDEQINEMSVWAEELTRMAVAFAPSLVLILVLLVGGNILAGWARGSVVKLMQRSGKVDATLIPFFGAVVRYSILVVVFIAILGEIGIETTSVLAALGGMALAVGLALQGTLSNLAWGLQILFLRPFGVGDFIDAGSATGTVKEIGLFTSKLETFDGVYVEAPNATLGSAVIHNYSRNPSRRIDIGVGVAYSDDLNGAMKVLLELMQGDERVYSDPGAEVMITELGDSAVTINMRMWCTRQDYWALKFDMTKAAKEAVEAAGYTIPFPQRDVHYHPLAS